MMALVRKGLGVVSSPEDLISSSQAFEVGCAQDAIVLHRF